MVDVIVLLFLVTCLVMLIVLTLHAVSFYSHSGYIFLLQVSATL